MKKIPLTQGKFALVDDDDYEKLNKYKWYAFKDGHTYYALRNVVVGPKKGEKGYQIILRMHRVILDDPPKEYYTDHIDGNGLNNQKANLRIVTRRQNNQNIVNIQKSSKYPGIYWHNRDKAWVAQIKIKGKTRRVGSSRSEEVAYNLYKEACAAIGCEILERKK